MRRTSTSDRCTARHCSYFRAYLNAREILACGARFKLNRRQRRLPQIEILPETHQRIAVWLNILVRRVDLNERQQKAHRSDSARSKSRIAHCGNHV